ncbi:MAG: hypothetical protein QM687_16035 [Ferruginibacter sp.]
MKPLQIFVTLFVIFSFSLLSCQKDFTVEDELSPEEPVNNLADSNYLDNIYEIDSIAGVSDTLVRWHYEYDSRKRVTSLNLFVYENGANEILIEKNTYFYNGNDSVPFKKLNVDYRDALEENNILLRDSITTFYEYTTQGKNLYDSSIEIEHYWDGSSVISEMIISVNRYQYAGTVIYNDFTNVTDNPSNLIIRYGRDTSHTDANGNVISNKRYEIDNGVSTLRYTSTFTYDDKPSPFYRLSNFRTLILTPSGETLDYEMQVYNNRLKTYEISDQGETNDYDYTGDYRYFTNGYPSRIMTEDSGSPGVKIITAFNYKTL